MSVLLHNLRGVLSIGVTWGVFWVAISAALVMVFRIFRPQDIDEGEGLIRVGGILGGVGLLAGIAFGVLLSVAERGRSILDIALSRDVGRPGVRGVSAPEREGGPGVRSLSRRRGPGHRGDHDGPEGGA